MPNLLYAYLNDIQYEPYRNFLRDRRYSSSDLGTAYRVINHWSDIGLIEDSRTSTKKWRKFSVIDISWVFLVHELRNYGLHLESLLRLKSMLFNQSNNDNLVYDQFEFLIFLVMAKKSVSLFVTIDGLEASIVDAEQFSEETIKKKIGDAVDKVSLIFVDLNRLMDKIYPLNDFKPYFKKIAALSARELEIIRFLRENDYIEVKIKFISGEISLFEGKQKLVNELKIIDALKDHDYQTIEVIKDNGKIVNFTRTIKHKPKHGNKPAK